MKTKTNRLQHRRINALNAVIEHNQLYLRTEKGSTRVVDARLERGAVAVTALYSGCLIPVEQRLTTGDGLINGLGYPVQFDEEGIAAVDSQISAP